jgi:chromosome partitioning protein
MTQAISGPAGREYSIGDVTRLLGVSKKWILQRETSGVLPAPRRTHGGHRTYSTEDLARIREIVGGEEAGGGKSADVVRGRIVLLNQKGGPGKTTIAQNLAYTLGGKGFRCLLVDTDRQGSLTICCGIDIRNEPERGLGHLLMEAARGRETEGLLRDNLCRTYNPNVHLLPTNEKMYDAQLHLQAHPEANFFLTELLRPLYGEYDFIFIDCPPDLGVVTVNALVAADFVILPVDHNLSVFTVQQFQQTLTAVQRRFNNQIRVLGVVLNKFSANTTNGRNVEEVVRNNYGTDLFATRITRTEKVPESQWSGRAFVDEEPKHPVSVQFRALADEVLDRMRRHSLSAPRDAAKGAAK